MTRIEIAPVPINSRKPDLQFFVMVDMTDDPKKGVQIFYMKSLNEEGFGDLWFPSREICLEQMYLNWGIDEFCWQPYTGAVKFD